MGSPSGSLLEAPPPPSFGKITDFPTPLSLQAAEAAGEQREEEEHGKTHSTVLSSRQQGSSANTSAADAPAGSTGPPALRIGSTEAGRQPQTSTSGNANLSPAHQGSTRGLTQQKKKRFQDDINVSSPKSALPDGNHPERCLAR